MTDLHAVPWPSSAAGSAARAFGAGMIDELLTSRDLVVVVRDVRDGRYRSVNGRFCDIVGLPSAQIVGRTGAEILPADVAAQHSARDREIVGDGVARTCREALVDRTGRRVELLSHRFVMHSASGRVDAVGMIGVDVTALAADAARDRQADERFRMVFDHAPIGQILSDLTGTITSVNGPMATMLGYRPEEMVGRPTQDFVPVAEFPAIREAARALLEGQLTAERAVRRFSHRNGREVPVSVTSTLLRDDAGRPNLWVSMALDLTDEERTRADLVRAHEAAVSAAERMRLLHAVATAANDALTLDELAPTIIDLVCQHFDWPAGALVTRPDDSSLPLEISYAAGDSAGLERTVPSVNGLPGVAIRPCPLVDGMVVVVPIKALGAERRGLLFRIPTGEFDESQTEMLTLVGLETVRVVERERAAQMLREGEQAFRSVFDGSPLPMGLSLGDTGTYAVVNAALCELVGRSESELLGHSAAAICHPDDLGLLDPAGAAAAADPNGRHQFELRLLHSSGTTIDAVVTLAWIEGADGTRQLLGQMEDVTARRHAETMLRWQADHDALTQLANRASLNRYLADMGRARAHCTVLFVDLDGFKLINDTRGHDVGDEVLITVAQRLQQAVRPTDLVARFGGDEFVVVCQQHDDASAADSLVVGEDARAIADRIETALGRPIDTASGPARITTSVGIAEGRIDPANPQELLRRSDAALYQAKSLGRDRRAYYDVALHRRDSDRTRTEAALRTALDDGRFTVHYQPIVSLADSSVLGFEALVRLVNEQGSLVPPGDFISVAEQSGLIVPMGTWVLQESCRTLADLRTRSGVPLTMSVNVAARQAARNDLGELVLAALDAAQLPHDALTLELTESALLEADDSTLAQLTMLRRHGVGISLDDFGTGYSSLTYLRRFPVSSLKIDRSFVSELCSDTQDRAIVRSVATLAEDLQLGWIAEGIETADQHDFLRWMGHGQGQGYLFSRPLPLDQLDTVVDLG